MKKIIPTILLALCLASCQKYGETPDDLNRCAIHPLHIVACNESGLVLVDNKGNLYTYTKYEWISGIAFKQGFKQGDLFGSTNTP